MTKTVCLLVAASFASAGQPVKLEPLWQHPAPGALPQALLRDAGGRDFLYAALKNGGLAILDISAGQPRQAAVIGRLRLGGLDVMNLAQQDDRLYLALGDFFRARGDKAGLAVVDVANPNRPEVLGVWRSPETLHGAAAVAVRGNWAWLAAMEHGVFAFDVSNPSRIEKAAQFVPDPNYPRPNPTRVQHPNARGLAIEGDRLYTAYDAGGLRIIDIADPHAPREIGRYSNAAMRARQQAYNNVVVAGGVAYVAVDYAGMEVLDVRDPAGIRQVSWWNPWDAHKLTNLWLNSPGHTNQLMLDADRRIVYLSAGDSEVLAVDVADPRQPALAGQFGEPRNGHGAWGLTVHQDRIYAAYITAAVPFRGTWAGVRALAIR